MSTINSILIANRGEIACRVIRTCKKMGIKSIAVYSDADKDAVFVHQADVAIHIGASQPSASYLDVNKIIDVAKQQGADAIHPGYGFLAENAPFAQLCQDNGLIFIGPNPNAIEAMGSKSQAKKIMEEHGVPVIPGYKGSDQRTETLAQAAKDIGFPVLLKATAGGGGKGMRIVNEAGDLENAIEGAKREALSSFGNDEMIIEKYFPSARHVEFQIFGDKHGNAIHVLERECSIQRRYQKIIEESPSPVLSEELRQEMGQAAVKAAKALDYDNAGTVEFILTDKNEFYFLEVNTRLQVEHPVTEEITGLDLVKMQIESAEGKLLAISQEEVVANGYAIESRLYAEDADNDFMPATGKIIKWEVPEVDGLRVETGVQTGSEVSIFYDPMIAKIVTHGQNRQEAQRKMLYTLERMVCLGLTTNQNFLIELLKNDDFQKGDYDTHFLKNKFNYAEKSRKEDRVLACLAVTADRWHKRENQRNILQKLPSGWRNNFYQPQKEGFVIGEEEIEVGYFFKEGKLRCTIGDDNISLEVIEKLGESIRVNIDGVHHTFKVVNNDNQFFVHNQSIGSLEIVLKDRFPEKEGEKLNGEYKSPMPGEVVKVLVAPGQEVNEGEGLVILSSMKMENTICAYEKGTIEDVFVEEGMQLESDFLLLKLQTENSN